MGHFQAEPGTIYHDLYDLVCRLTRSISESPILFYGDLTGKGCWYLQQIGPLQILIVTPTEPCLDVVSDLEIGRWSRRWRYWDRSTGIVQLSQVVSDDAVDFFWLDISGIAKTLHLTAAELEGSFFEQLESLNNSELWFGPEFLRDGTYRIVPAEKGHKRAMRRVSLHKTNRQHVIWGQARACLGRLALEYPIPLGSLPSFDCNKRLECLTFEFKLEGRHSFEYTFA